MNRVGGIGPAVEKGIVTSGVMYEAAKKSIPFVLAGSIRDDGPLLDTITDMVAAQKAYVEALRGAGMCLMLASALHSIAVGNLLPARVRTVCVDMTESVPVKLSNRGTHAGHRPGDRRGLLPRAPRERAQVAGELPGNSLWKQLTAGARRLTIRLV